MNHFHHAFAPDRYQIQNQARQWVLQRNPGLSLLTIKDLTPAQVALVEPHLWAVDRDGTVCNATRRKGDESPFPYAAAVGLGRRVMVMAPSKGDAQVVSDVHNLAILKLVRHAAI